MESLHCDKHIDMNSVGSCCICARPVCGDCAVTIDGKIFCDDRSHQTLLSECEELLTTATSFEMELIAKNLASHGVDAHWFDLQQYGCSPGAKIFVNKKVSEKAVAILETLDLLDFTSRHSYGK